MNIFSKGRVVFYSMARQWYQFYCGPFKVSRNGSFWVCEVSSLQEVNISFEPEFGNSSFETQEKQNAFNFQLTFLSTIVGFIQASAEKPGVLNVFLSYFLCSAAKEGFQTQLFKTQVLTQLDFENPPKIHF